MNNSKPKSVKILPDTYKKLKTTANQEKRNLQMMLAVVMDSYLAAQASRKQSGQ